ncbi:MAG TPA: glycine oxidase ThiO [Thermoleophilaceae bacterium]|nr:glycine oxidase ThiO [Thermoleophilaceae bacterium]
MPAPRRESYDVAVVGGGLIGLACAWRSADRGMSAVVIERDRPGAGASGVAAGMLAPVTEADFGEQALLRLGLASRELWPGFAAELEERSGMPTFFRESGALVVAADRDDAEELGRLHRFQRELGLDADWLAPRECRRLEPALAPSVAGGVLAPQDAQADPAATVAALERMVEVLRAEAQAVESAHGRVSGVRLADGGFVNAGQVVIAAGPWSPALDPGGAGPPVRPVKGQILELRVREGMPVPVERIVRSPRCYLLARPDGRVVLGATVEEQGFDTALTAGGVYRLLDAAREILPEVEELELVQVRAGLRPGTPDNAPLIGPGSTEGLLWATGHHRNGVLLAPVTARALAAVLAGEPAPGELAAFSPQRFERVPA